MENALERTLALPVWMRDPQWRWKLALMPRANPMLSIVPLRRDDSLYLAARFFKSLCRRPGDHAYRRRTYPEMIVAYAIWAGASLTAIAGLGGAGRWRGLVESLLLTDLPYSSFSEAIGVDMPAGVVRLYHDVFFDVRSYIDSEPAVYANVLSAAEQQLSPAGISGTLERNCLLRLFSYTWGAEALLSYFFSRARGQNMAHSRWMRLLAGEVLTQQVVHDAISRRAFCLKECQDTFKMAQTYWQMPPQSIGSVEEEVRKRFLHDTVMLLSDTLSQADRMKAMRGISREQALEEAQSDGFIQL